MLHRFCSFLALGAILFGVSACASKEERRIARISEPNVVVPKAEFTSQQVTKLFLDVCVEHVDDPSFVRKKGRELGLKRYERPSPDFYFASRNTDDGGRVKLNFGDSTILWHSSNDAGSFDVFHCSFAANVSDALAPLSDQLFKALSEEPTFFADDARWKKSRTMEATSLGRKGILRVRLPSPIIGSSSLCKGIPDCSFVGALSLELEVRR